MTKIKRYASKSAHGFYSDDLFSTGDMPPDVVQISEELYLECLAADRIDWSEYRPRPLAYEPGPSAILDQIAKLEAKITPRRLREALLTGDHSFVQSIDSQIAALRAQL